MTDCLLDSSESDSVLNSSVAEADTAEVQTAAVELDSEQIALYRGNREYQAITVEHYCIGIHLLTFPTSICIDSNCWLFSVTKVFQILSVGQRVAQAHYSSIRPSQSLQCLHCDAVILG